MPLKPYLEARTNVIVTRGTAGANGRLVYAETSRGAVTARYQGDATIGDFGALVGGGNPVAHE